ncbi:MAG TPA: hypothetical protein VNJ48_17210 [Nocardioides sp.]|nr:hypothetical protein [Nocardioides sp.]
MDWVDPLLRGIVGLIATGLLIIGARIRYQQKGTIDGPRDLGLD